MSPFLLILILVAAWFLFRKRDSFSNKPSTTEIDNMVHEIIAHRDSFSQNMYSAKEKMPWIDAIIYEEVRAKIRENKFNSNDLKQIFTV